MVDVGSTDSKRGVAELRDVWKIRLTLRHCSSSETVRRFPYKNASSDEDELVCKLMVKMKTRPWMPSQQTILALVLISRVPQCNY
jgi:hypothetical protein